MYSCSQYRKQTKRQTQWIATTVKQYPDRNVTSEHEDLYTLAWFQSNDSQSEEQKPSALLTHKITKILQYIS